MKTFYDCLPCFVAQAIAALERCGLDEPAFQETMRAVFMELARVDFAAPPPATVRNLYRLIRQTTGTTDPYTAEKRHSNRLAQALAEKFKGKIEASGDSFTARLKMALAANSIDYGRYGRLQEEDVLEAMETALAAPVDADAATALRRAVAEADRILYLCDNAGEIVFDRLFIEILPTAKITAVVRGAPVINDATLEDARAVGLAEVVQVEGNGSDAPGTLLETCSQAFLERFAAADLVIAKGQGNFETLSEAGGKRIFFLLKVKCPLIARDIGEPVGQLVVKEHLRPAVVPNP
ncbi:MAG: ARMT1-like domain-containing protein [Desulfobacteraceae bacterium]|nr:ARMT1-like domain-containing protein [Desulfobacteraceae bacterium]